ncbi:uncharacterized protein LOC124151383 [Haliotis rufescens]|uniref:uncharacterized protein LOC124151383 n=1 Tax=Haliotis rufescens TaxID=6454 RepID=UPI001EAF9540|nr:uncharacterized protein LOC124151383 [Haliotis rufescens]
MVRVPACLVLALMYVAAESDSSTQTRIIDYRNGLYYEDLGHNFLVLVMPDGCYFWHLTPNEISVGLSPGGFRHTESTFVAAIENGFDMTMINRINFNHMAYAVVGHCSHRDSFLIHRGHMNLNDLSSFGLQGSIAPNAEVVHARS